MVDFARINRERKQSNLPNATALALNASVKEEKPTHPVGVSVLLTDSQGRVLLAKRKNNSGAGLLSTPGGRLEKTETIEQCAAREFEEETGAQLGPVKIIAWKEHFRYGNHYIMFYAHATTYTGWLRNCIPDKSEEWEYFDRFLLTETNCTEPQDVLALLPRPTNHHAGCVCIYCVAPA
jgi:8-oxo-dGTP pyrophosphatase MutT (NUDIX family)